MLDDVQVVAQREVLVDGLDPERPRRRGASDVHRLPSTSDLAVVGAGCAGQHLDQRRLAGAVVAESAITSPARMFESTLRSGLARARRPRPAASAGHLELNFIE